MTDREQWEELAFFELANGDSGDAFADGWDDPEDELLKEDLDEFDEDDV
ncbi:MAG: hypothetical protein IH607_04310 [Firmicutes bacterium]|nr:hypothetical protein [Bacillota bacterium]